MDYSEFFSRATDCSPFAYQQELSQGAQLPWVLNAPTGTGKTDAVVLAWLWRRRHHPSEAVRNATPRRLVYCLPTRVLVEQTAQKARTWLDNLDLLALDSESAGRIAVYQLMAGESGDDWDAWPEAEAVLVGTQDQLISRALNRGYGTSRSRWPLQCGLLNSDALWVFDEVQLMGPALATSLQLQGLREKWGASAGPASLWMSATLDTSSFTAPDFSPTDIPARTLTLSPADRRNPQLAMRLTASKPIQQCSVTPAKGKSNYARDLAEAVQKAHVPGARTLVVLNQVRRAQDLYRHLQRLQAKQADAPALLLLHSRFRPAERRELEQGLRRDPSPAGCIIVATQTVEAGVDLSAQVMFTELAPWTSLVQRFGRCNRYGECGSDNPAQVYWVDVTDDPSPYTAEELSAARSLLTETTDVGIEGLSACAAPPASSAASAKWQVLRATDFLDLFDTTPDLDGHDIDVSPYIRETDDLDAFVFWRTYDAANTPEDTSAPRREELCPVSVARLREALTKPGQKLSPLVWDSLDEAWVRLDVRRLYPGMTVVLDAKGGCYAQDTGWDPAATDPVEVVPAQAPTMPDTYGGDPASQASGHAVTLRKHSDDVAQEVQALIAALADLSAYAPELLQAARWHDVGKAHPVFQNWLRSGGGLTEDELWAKAPGKLSSPKDRRYFRHELASALAALQAGQEDLVAYLVAAHHGRIRMLIRSLPTERRPDSGVRFARGVWEGDVLPRLDLGDGQVCPETTLSLQVMELGESEFGPSWLARALNLRDGLGPFRLAYLEAILRVADWRASAKEAQGDD